MKKMKLIVFYLKKNKSIKSNNLSQEIDILKNTDMKNIELEVLIQNYNDTQKK